MSERHSEGIGERQDVGGVVARIRGGPFHYVGGDINGGVQDLGQLFTRPTFRRVPYSTPAKGIYICSSSTPPGGGVHGMCGHHAANAALRRDL